MQDVNKVSYNKDGVWIKWKIDNISSGVYHLSEFKHRSNTQEIWGEDIQDFGKNWIGLVKENFIILVWKIISFIPNKNSPVLSSLAYLVSTKTLPRSFHSSLKAELTTSLANHQTWLERYKEEYGILIGMGTWESIYVQ